MDPKFIEVLVVPFFIPPNEYTLSLTEKHGSNPRAIEMDAPRDTVTYVYSTLGLTPRDDYPLIFDLTLYVLKKGDIQIQAVKITELVDDSFRATITLRIGDKVETVACRPSDVIPLALQVGAPIYVAEELFDEEPFDEEPLDEDPSGKDIAEGS